MSELHAVANNDQSSRVGDVIFVHGLNGNAYTTWQSGKDQETFWPVWLGQDLPDVGIWTLSYDVNSSAWRGHTMPLIDRATHVLALLEAHNLMKRPLVIVAHSLGGLLVKQMLQHAVSLNVPAWQSFPLQTKGIVFLSTPHSGSDIASWLKYLSRLLRSTVSVRELEAHAPQLRQLNTWYRNNVASLHIKTQVYLEKLPTHGIWVVKEGSADPGIAGVPAIPLDADHFSISRPDSRSSLLYLGVKRFIEDCFAQSLSETQASMMTAAPELHKSVVGVSITNNASSYGPQGEFFAPISIDYGSLRSNTDDEAEEISS